MRTGGQVIGFIRRLSDPEHEKISGVCGSAECIQTQFHGLTKRYGSDATVHSAFLTRRVGYQIVVGVEDCALKWEQNVTS